MCKPHKMGWENRWKTKELFALKEAERQIFSAVRRPVFE